MNFLIHKQKKRYKPLFIRLVALLELAEGMGFEPMIPFRVYRFSRPAHSTTLTSFQNVLI